MKTFLYVDGFNLYFLSGPKRRQFRKNAGLQKAATFYKNGITWSQLEGSQFRKTLTDAHVSFHKPPSW